ncbi:pre-rRNA 2'-O-ribose RNA methyltransferase FTSJ3 [Rhincodon typus]|uniref:pre-rRNA 2'-O-ribose RNA methyltransferase FTSJ3 n=1 Tax=Rhincodon typus TaxID=259920 RepID=UPI00202E2597|nr:pre-rRNA 2'-O-ribose RNA methyltransferase FTSJ3 [Rhincodon typus]
MGKKLKVGKTRKDKFYHLAKETGYRSRSAFKLIQLNRKFQFLQRARALLDLCAAPGGWLQVAANFMPVSSLVIGVDLVPIKPIPNVVTLQEDITTEKCRQALRKELQTWKVDVVLNDGAPNVGANWLHDAYSQAHLTLMALKLACEFLNKGGYFITKVFRSKDYQPLLWILQQFFRKVQATKPQASRNESAEIFVVCQGYVAPDKIDHKFFDPKHAFKEVEVQAKTIRDLVTVKKPKAEGYAEGDYTLYHRFTLMEFVKAQNPVDFLDKASEITIDDPELEKHAATTQEILECCKDVRVLGRKELRLLLNWRTKLRRHLAKKLKEQAKELGEEFSLSSEDESEAEKDVPEQREQEGDEGTEDEEQMEQQLTLLKAEEVAELKRKKKKVLKERRKQRERIELKMDLPGVSIADDAEVCLFSLKAINHKKLKEIEQGDMKMADKALEEGLLDQDGINLSDPEMVDNVSLASDLDSSDFEDVKEREQQLNKKKKMPRKRPQAPQAAVGQAPELDEEEGNSLLVELESKAVRQERQADLWFGKDIFAGLETDADEAIEIKQTKKLYMEQGRVLADEVGREDDQQNKPHTVAEGEQQKTAKEGPTQGEKESEEDSSSDESDIRAMKRVGSEGNKQTLDETDTFEVVEVEKSMKRAQVLDPEGLALGASIATSKKRTRDLIDDSFNRYTFDEEQDELPDWFVENEQRFRQRPPPITASQKQQGLSCRNDVGIFLPTRGPNSFPEATAHVREWASALTLSPSPSGLECQGLAASHVTREDASHLPGGLHTGRWACTGRHLVWAEVRPTCGHFNHLPIVGREVQGCGWPARGQLACCTRRVCVHSDDPYHEDRRRHPQDVCYQDQTDVSNMAGLGRVNLPSVYHHGDAPQTS